MENKKEYTFKKKILLNMKKTNCYILSLLMAAALTACSSDVDQGQQSPFTDLSPDGAVPVTFSVSDLRDFTRAASSIVTFNANEKVKVFVKPNGASDYTQYDYKTAAGQSNVSLTLEKNYATNDATPPYFPAGTGTTVQAYAYYPATAASTFSVADDQTTDANYKASDLMHAEVRTITKGSSAGTNLQMSHLMAQLHLNVTGVGLTVNRVLVNAKRSVTFTPSAGTATATGTASDIVAATAAGDAYVCIPVQPINTVTIKVETGSQNDANTTATFTFTSTDDFEAGKSYPINLTVNATSLGNTTAISDWNGQQSVTYAPTGDLTIDPISEVTYNGSAYTPTLVVKKGSTTLTKDAANGYTCQWFNNTNAGTAVVLVLGQGTYAGSVAVGKFTINPKTLTASMVAAISAQTYTRSQLTPTVTVTDGSALTLNTDYTVSYGANVNAATDGGSATVTGTGNYTGSVTKNFTISPKSISSMTLTLSQTATTYTGSAITASVSSLKDGTYTLSSSTDYTVASGSVTSATNAASSASAAVTNNTITVNGKGNYTGSVSKTWSIARATPSLTISSYSPNPMNLTSSSATGTITVSRDGDGAITASSSDESVATTSVSGTTVTVTAIADGSATITVKMNQGTNYTAYTASDKTVSVSASGFIKAPALGDKYYSDGTWGDNDHAANATVIGVVAWLGNDSDLKCGKSHGLVMAKTDAQSGSSYTMTWGPTSTDESFLSYSTDLNGCKNQDKNGLTNTSNLVADSHTHDAASAAYGYTPAAPTSAGATQWFLPSAAQWIAVLGPNGLGGLSDSTIKFGSWFDTGSDSSSKQSSFTNINNALTATGVGGTALTNGAVYWSSSEYSANGAVYVVFNSSNGVDVRSGNKSGTYRVRAFLAF